ncbi:hypothetical protein Q4543_15060 [Salipiger sp. 1_MG-2023]|uniref:hypothetical protein n=1 Tax=Salipiger sp. 1_MG-2023 TaxID=3062665 RepID=UPI0026E2CA7A|nr:hypothetical protein [Salipiger sp. 1_MG-2023]MDO6586831.1 hypothetical protein [Salipiger sp. 1_MG-2023]
MSTATPLAIVRRRAFPLGQLELDLMQSACGARPWALRTAPEMGAACRVLTNGFCDSAAERAELAAQLRALADAVEAWVE